MKKRRWEHWSGYQYELTTKRSWNYFFDYILEFKVSRSQLRAFLPPENASHMLMHFDQAEAYRERFRNFDEWWSFQSTVCDEYCRYFLLGVSSDENLFKRDMPWHKEWHPNPRYERNLGVLASTYKSFGENVKDNG